MSQDTTLPPLPHPLLIAGGKNWFTIEQMHAYARAAIAAQAPQPSLDRDAAIRTWRKHYSAFRSTLGDSAEVPPSPVIDAMLDFAKAAQAQQAQGVPAGFERVTLPGGSYGWRYAVAESAQLLRAIDKNGGLSSGGESYPNALCVHDMAQRLGALLKLAAAPQAEPQPEREPTRLETLHAWATSGEPPCNSFDKGYEAAREFVAMQLAGIGTKGGDK